MPEARASGGSVPEVVKGHIKPFLQGPHHSGEIHLFVNLSEYICLQIPLAAVAKARVCQGCHPAEGQPA